MSLDSIQNVDEKGKKLPGLIQFAFCHCMLSEVKKKQKNIFAFFRMYNQSLSEIKVTITR